MGYPTNPPTFADLPVVNYNQDSVGEPIGVDDLAKVAWRLGVEYDDGPDEFAELKRLALARGFVHVESGPLVRSSYHAHEQADAFQAFSSGPRPLGLGLEEPPAR